MFVHTHIILLPWDLLGLGSDAGGGKLSCDATGPSFCSRATHPPPHPGGPSPAPAEGLLMAGEEGGVLFSLRAARRQMLACSLPVIKRPPARLSPALCCAAKRRHAASRCGPWRAPRRRCRCRARPGRSPRASAAVAGVWAGCDGACCRTPRAGGGRLTVPHRAPSSTLLALAPGGPCSPAFGVRRGTAPAQLQAGGSGCPQLCRAVGEGRWGAACATQGLCKLLGTAVARCAVPCCAMQLAWMPGLCPLCHAVPLHAQPWGQHLPSAVRAVFPIEKSFCSPLDPSLGLPPPAAVVPRLCNLLPPALTAYEPSWLTRVGRVLLLLTPAKGILYP